MFEQFFNLRENPFTLAPNPRFIFRSHEHTEALAHLRYWIENGEGFVLITGEVGTGKTTALFDLMGQLGTEWAVAFVANSTLTEPELLEEICRRFQVEIPAVPTKPALLQGLEHYLTERNGKGLGSLLILDEAQNFENRMLEEVRLLSNLERAQGKLIQIALVGQPELERKIEQPGLRQLRQRIGVRYRLNPLSEEETVHYLHHRLTVAGGDAQAILPHESGVEIHRLTHGIPREINIVASQALISAFVQGAAQVAPEHVRNVMLDFAWSSILGRGPLPPAPRWEPRPVSPASGPVPPPRVDMPPAPVDIPLARVDIPPARVDMPRADVPPVRVDVPPARVDAPPPLSPASPRAVAGPPRVAAGPPPAESHGFEVGSPPARPPLEVLRGGGAPTKMERVAEAQGSAARASSPRLEAGEAPAGGERARVASESRAWFDSLTETEKPDRSWQRIFLWALLLVALVAGGGFLWSNRSILGLAPARQGEIPRREEGATAEPTVASPAGEGQQTSGQGPAEGKDAVAPAAGGASAKPAPSGGATSKAATTKAASTKAASQSAPDKVATTQPAPSKPAPSQRTPSKVTSRPTSSQPATNQPARTQSQPSTPPQKSTGAGAPAGAAPVPEAPAAQTPNERPRPGPYAAAPELPSGVYSVQVASFRGDAGAVARAQVEYERRHRQPIEIVSAQVNDRLWHRVCVGRYPTFEEAERALAKLEAEGAIHTGLVRHLTSPRLASD